MMNADLKVDSLVKSIINTGGNLFLCDVHPDDRLFFIACMPDDCEYIVLQIGDVVWALTSKRNVGYGTIKRIAADRAAEVLKLKLAEPYRDLKVSDTWAQLLGLRRPRRMQRA
jgi:hypothetical protein